MPDDFDAMWAAFADEGGDAKTAVAPAPNPRPNPSPTATATDDFEQQWAAFAGAPEPEAKPELTPVQERIAFHAREDALKGGDPSFWNARNVVQQYMGDFHTSPEDEALYSQVYDKYAPMKQTYALARQIARYGTDDYQKLIKQLPEDQRPYLDEFIQELTKPEQRSAAGKIGEALYRGAKSVKNVAGNFASTFGPEAAVYTNPIGLPLEVIGRLTGQGSLAKYLREKATNAGWIEKPEDAAAVMNAERARNSADALQTDISKREGALDSVEGFGAWLGNVAYGTVEAVPDLAASTVAGIPTAGAGTVAYWMAKLAPERYAEFKKAGMSEENARAAGVVSAVPEALLSLLKIKHIAPGLMKEAEGIVVNTWRQALTEWTKRGAKAGTDMALQDATRRTVLTLGTWLDDKAPDVDWRAEAKDWFKGLPDAYASGMMLSAPGVVGEDHSYRKAASDFLARDTAAAFELSRKERPSRTDFDRAGVGIKLSADERAAFTKELREAINRKEPAPAKIEGEKADDIGSTEATNREAQAAPPERAPMESRPNADAAFHEAELSKEGLSAEKVQAAKSHLKRFEEDFSGALPPDQAKPVLERLSEGGSKPVTVASVDVANGAGINALRGSVSKTNADITKIADMIRTSMDEALPDTDYRLVRKGWKFQVFTQTENQEAVKSALQKAEVRVKEYARAEGLESAKPREGDNATPGVYFKSVEVEKAGAGPMSKAILAEHAPPRLSEKVPTAKEIEAKKKAGAFLSQKEHVVEQLLKAGWTEAEITKHRGEISAFHEDRVLQGYGSKGMRDSSVARGIEHAEKTGRSGVYVEVDIGNLGGLTKHFVNKSRGLRKAEAAERRGRKAADAHFAAVAEILKKHLPEAEFFRHGADELGIHLPEVTAEAARAKLEAASKEIAAYEKANNLETVKHTKSGREPGFGVVWGLSAYDGNEKANSIIGEADRLVEKLKKGGQHEFGGSSRAFRVGAPEPRGAVEGTGSPDRGRRQTEERTSGADSSAPGEGQPKRRNPFARRADVSEGGKDAAQDRGGPARRISAVTGSDTELLAPAGKERVPAKFAVVEAGDLIPSHDFRRQSPTPRKEYPAELQPRSYAPKDANAQKVVEIAGNLDASRLITDAPGMDAGTPTILPNGIVVAGNGRAMGIQRAAARPMNPKQYAEYRRALLSKAAQFGLDPKQIEGLKKPVLVRMVEADASSETARLIASASNLSTAYRENPVRKAAQLAPLVPDEVFDQLRSDPEATFSKLVTDETRGRAFRETLLKAIPAAERGEYFGQAGELTDAGKELVEALMVVKVMPVDLVEKMPRSLRGTLEAAAPQLVMMKRGRGIDLLPALREAIEFRLGPLENGKLTYDEYQGQGQMFEQPKTLSLEGRMLLDFVTENGSKPKLFREALGNLITEAEQTGPGSLLGSQEGNEPAKMVADALGVKKQKGATFEAQPESRAKPDRGRRESKGEQALAARVGSFGIPVELDAKGEKISNHEIIATMAREFDIPIRTGKVSNPLAAGIYKTKPEVVRLKGAFSGDLAVTSHEVAHHIDKINRLVKDLPYNKGLRPELAKLDYNPNRGDKHEGFAEFMRHYLSDDNAQQKAPRFFKYFTETWLPANPETAAKIEKVKALVDRWRQQGAESRIKANISQDGKPARPVDVPVSEWLQEKAADTWNRVYTAMKDEGHYLNLFEREAKEKGYAPREGEGPYALYESMNQAGPTFAKRAIEEGPFAMSEGRFGKKLGPSLKEAFQGIEPKEYEDFVAWAYARHARESWAKGKNPGINLADADYLYNRDKNPTWEKAADNLTAFNNGLIDMLHDAGVITPESAAKIKGEYETYLPLMRVRESIRPGKGFGKKLVNQGAPLKGRKGSGHQVIDPVQSTVERAIRFYERAAQQQVIESTIRAAEKTEGMGGWIEKVPPGQQRTTLTVDEIAPQLKKLGIDPEALSGIDPSEVLNLYRPDYNYRGDQPIARVIRKGKASLYAFDPDLFRAVSGMNHFQLPYFLDLTLGRATRLTKLGATGLNPDFTLRNAIRDYGTYLFQKKAATGARSLVSPGEMLGSYLYSEAMKLTGKEGDPIVKLWQDMGGELSQTLGLDQKRLRAAVEDVANDAGAAKALKIAKHPLDAMRQAIGVTEVASRLAEFKASLEKSGWSRARIEAEGPPPRRVLVAAANAAADVTVNFRRMGYVGKWLNQVIPFFNASLEGSDKFARTWKDDPKKALIMAAGIASATMVYWLKRHKDDDYQEQPAWLKYGYLTLTDDKGKPVARVPRPYEVGMTISAGTEALLNAISEKNPEALKEWSGEAYKTLTPGLKPAGITPVVETAFNYDTFRERPIVDEWLAKREPKDQAQPWNTELMKRIGEYLNVSPAKVEFLTNGLTGGMYSRAAHLGNIQDAADVPGTGGLMLRKDYSKNTDAFYRERDEVEQKYNSAMDRAKEKDPQNPHAPLDLERRHRLLTQYAELFGDLRGLVKGERQRDARFDVEKYIIGLSRQAEGQPDLERYPAFFTAKNLPTALAEVRDKFIWKKIQALTQAPPREEEKEPAYNQHVEEALDWLRSVGLDADTVREIAEAKIVNSIKSAESKKRRRAWLEEYLDRLQPARR